MAAITQLAAKITTNEGANAKTDGTVYLGICGREFKLNAADPDFNDFESGSNKTYRLGVNANVSDPTHNDPRTPQLDTSDADLYPTYIRFEPSPTDDSPDWDLDGVEVTITPGGGKYGRLGDFNTGGHLWLGQNMGKFCYLRKM